MAHGVTSQVHIEWRPNDLKLYIDRVLAFNVPGSPLGGVDNRTEVNHLVVGRKWNSLTEYAEVEIDNIQVWDGTVTHDPFLPEGETHLFIYLYIFINILSNAH